MQLQVIKQLYSLQQKQTASTPDGDGSSKFYSGEESKEEIQTDEFEVDTIYDNADK